jgi:TRAP-type C4-dicarboxylate transport system permease small subunit
MDDRTINSTAGGPTALRYISWCACRVAEAIGMLGLSVGIVLQLINLVMRDLGLTSSVPTWLNDVSTLALVSGAFIYCAATERHIGFGGVLRLLPEGPLRTWAWRFSQLVTTVLLVVLTVGGVQLVQDQAAVGGSYSSSFNFPIAAFYAIAPLTFGLAALRWLSQIPGTPPPDEGHQT